MDSYGYSSPYSTPLYGYSSHYSPFDNQIYASYPNYGYGFSSNLRYHSYESFQVHNKWYQSDAPEPPVKMINRGQVWNETVDSKAGLGGFPVSTDYQALSQPSIENNPTKNLVKEDDDSLIVLEQKMRKLLDEMKARTLKLVNTIDQFNQRGYKPVTAVKEKIEVGDGFEEVDSKVLSVQEEPKLDEHQLFDKMLEPGYEALIEEFSIDGEVLSRDGSKLEEQQLFDEISESRIRNGQTQMFEVIVEANFSGTRLQDKWYLSFSRKPKMKRIWKEKYWIDLAVWVEILTLVNASDLSSGTHMEDDADSKHEKCLENESNSPDGGDLLPLHGNGSKINVLSSHCPFLPELKSRRKSIVAITSVADIAIFAFLAKTIQLISLIINTFCRSSIISTPYSNKEDFLCQLIINSSSRHEVVEAFSTRKLILQDDVMIGRHKENRSDRRQHVFPRQMMRGQSRIISHPSKPTAKQNVEKWYFVQRRKYGFKTVHLHIYIDHFLLDSQYGTADLDQWLNLSKKIVEFVDGFDWKFGEKWVRYRTNRASNSWLQSQWLEGRWLTSDHEFAFVVEDDFDVSSLYHRFLKALTLSCYYNTTNYSPPTYGASLQWSMVVRGKHGNKMQLKSGARIGLYQLIGNWGRLVLPRHWKEFWLWYDSQQAKYFKPFLDGTATIRWYWKLGQKICTHWLIKFIQYQVNYEKTAMRDSYSLDEGSIDFNLLDLCSSNDLKLCDFCFRELKSEGIVRNSNELAKMIIHHDYLLHLIELTGYIEFSRGLQAQFHLTSVNTVEEKIRGIFMRKKYKLMDPVSVITRLLSLVVNLWTTSQSLAFALLTDSVFDEVVADCVTDWTIEDKLFTLTLDCFYPRCYARILISLAQDTIESMKGTNENVQQGMKCVKISEACEERFIKLKRQLQFPSNLEFTEMAWDGVVGAMAATRDSKQQLVEIEHLMKSLSEQKHRLARRMFTKACFDNSTLLQITEDFVSQQPKVSGDTSGPILGSYFSYMLVGDFLVAWPSMVNSESSGQSISSLFTEALPYLDSDQCYTDKDEGESLLTCGGNSSLRSELHEMGVLPVTLRDFSFLIKRGIIIADIVSVNYDDFINDVEVGDIIMVDDGMMSFTVKSKIHDEAKCEIVYGGELKSMRQVTVRGKKCDSSFK